MDPANAVNSPRPEDVAGESLDDEGAETVTVFLDGLKDVLDHEFIDRFHVAAGGIAEDLFDQVAGENVCPARNEDVFEIVKAGIGFTGAELAGGINLRCGRIALRFRIRLPPAADRIEGLETEAERIDLAMAFGAGFVGPVFLEPLADGGGPAHVRFDGRNHIRWRWRLDAENVFRNPDAASNGRSFNPVRADREDGRHAEKAATLAAAIDAD